MFEHVIITRFNLKKKGWETSKNNIPVLTTAWLERRFELFENFCFPSIKAQTNQNFKWLVYFDIDTPQKFKDRILGLSIGYPNFIPKYVANMNEFVPAIQEELKNLPSEYIISSRIDNDDCLSKYYVEEIQKRFKKSTHLAFDFPDGYTLQISPDYRIGKKRQLWNPFISFIEENKNPQSVWQKDHAAWKIDPLVERINKKRTWMSIIHQENKINEFTGYGRVNLKEITDNFVISPKKLQEIEQQIQPQNSWKLKSMQNFLDTWFTCNYKDLKKFWRLKIKG